MVVTPSLWTAIAFLVQFNTAVPLLTYTSEAECLRNAEIVLVEWGHPTICVETHRGIEGA